MQTKQIQVCRASCLIDGSQAHGCKYGFPFLEHLKTMPTIDPVLHKWLYYRPSSLHQNVIPYHAAILMLWQGHMNIQRIGNNGLSYYLLKYAMKTKPFGCINLNFNDAKRLRLDNLDPLKLKMISAYILSKPTSPIEVAITCLQIPTIQRSEAVHYIDWSPPSLHQRYVHQHGSPHCTLWTHTLRDRMHSRA